MSDWSAATPSVVLIAARAAEARQAIAAIEASAARLAATIDFAAAATGLDAQGYADVLLVETAGADADLLTVVLDLIVDYAARGGAVIVSFPEIQLDEVAGALLGSRVELLCAPDIVERATAIAVALAGRGGRLREEGDESEAARLKRLNDEIARIADLLARLGRDATPPSGMQDRRRDFRAEADDGVIAPAEIRRAIRARRLRDQFFGDGLFEDPAWDMLLDLFAADLEGAQVSVSSLCIAAAVAPTTALRWIGRLTEAGLIARHPDPSDRRRAFMLLSSSARNDMRRYWQAMRRLGGPLV
ncbi:MAG: hypothetical protein K2Y20_01065 [Sphingomonas sp.]|nr:hypothetical protein [Sphingomonas sp.]